MSAYVNAARAALALPKPPDDGDDPGNERNNAANPSDNPHGQ